MRATFKLINSYFWKTMYGPILSFIFPLLLLAVLGNVMRIQYVYPGIIALTMLFIGTLALPLAIMELKGSSLFKYIGSSPVNPMKFSIVVVLYYTFIAILTGIVIMLGAMIIFSKEVFPSNGFKYGIIGGLSTVNGFFSFYSATFIHLLLVISVGLGISTFSKTPQQALTIAIIIIIPSMFLSGMVLSVDIIAQSDAMQWISRLIPFRYSTGNIVVATTPLTQLGDLFNQITAENRELIFGNAVITDARIRGWTDRLLEEGIPKEELDLLKIKWSKEIGNLMIFNSAENNSFSTQILKGTNEIIDYYNDPNTDNSSLWSSSDALEIPGDNVKGDQVLFKLIFLKESAKFVSDNNMFNFTQPWAVRRIPDVSQINSFMKSYLRGDGSELDPTRFQTIQNLVNEDNFGFMDIFLKQNNVLYTLPERSLNLFLPLLSTGILGLYTWKKFSWSSR